MFVFVACGFTTQDLRQAYAVLLSGPSGSADIGGVTVHPAQGVTTMTIILWPRG